MVDREASEITLDLRREVCSVKSAPPEWPYVRRSRAEADLPGHRDSDPDQQKEA